MPGLYFRIFNRYNMHELNMKWKQLLFCIFLINQRFMDGEREREREREREKERTLAVTPPPSWT